jgi:hypothetical protein
MRQSRAPLRGQAVFFAAQFSAGYITSMPGFDLRQAQLSASILNVRIQITRLLQLDMGAFDDIAPASGLP